MRESTINIQIFPEKFTPPAPRDKMFYVGCSGYGIRPGETGATSEILASLAVYEVITLRVGDEPPSNFEALPSDAFVPYAERVYARRTEPWAILLHLSEHRNDMHPDGTRHPDGMWHPDEVRALIVALAASSAGVFAMNTVSTLVGVPTALQQAAVKQAYDIRDFRDKRRGGFGFLDTIGR